MQRLRELLAHGGIAILAFVFALALAAFDLADAFAQVLIFILQQHSGDPEGGEPPLQIQLAGTEIDYSAVLQKVLAVALLVAGLYATWRALGGTARRCAECLSDVPRRASVCRYCTSELPEAP